METQARLTGGLQVVWPEVSEAGTSFGSEAGGAGSTAGPDCGCRFSGATVGDCPTAGAGAAAASFPVGVGIVSNDRSSFPVSVGFSTRIAPAALPVAGACFGSTCCSPDPVQPSAAGDIADLSLNVFDWAAAASGAGAAAGVGASDGGATGDGAEVGRATAAGAVPTALVCETAAGIGLPQGSSGTRITTVRGERTV